MSEFHLHLYGPFTEEGGQPSPFPSRFETALTRLQTAYPEALIEMDGSVAWASPSHQLVGMLYDAGEAIEYVELRGRCSRSQLLDFVENLAEEGQIGAFAVMELPQRQWKKLQHFAIQLPE
ncbi:MAG: hypothetical protein AAFX06_01115 [Planctomycetota bacterium]